MATLTRSDKLMVLKLIKLLNADVDADANADAATNCLSCGYKKTSNLRNLKIKLANYRHDKFRSIRSPLSAKRKKQEKPTKYAAPERTSNA